MRRLVPHGRGGGRRFSRAAWRGAVLALVLPVLAPPAPARADPKTDIVVLKNGNTITCEIKRLSRGKLRVKTDDMGTVDIEWDKIESVTAPGSSRSRT